MKCDTNIFRVCLPTIIPANFLPGGILQYPSIFFELNQQELVQYVYVQLITHSRCSEKRNSWKTTRTTVSGSDKKEDGYKGHKIADHKNNSSRSKRR